MIIRIISFTDQGENLAEKVAEKLAGSRPVPQDHSGKGQKRQTADVPAMSERRMDPIDVSTVRCKKPVTLSDWTRKAFQEAQALIFIGAAGIAVRAVAPLIRNKTEDPAVIVIDETGFFVIPILSGHLGGANDLARWIAREIGAEAVITTATDRRGVFAVDEWARNQNLAIRNPRGIKRISGRLLAGEMVRIRSDYLLPADCPPGILVTGRKGSCTPAKAEGTEQTDQIGCEPSSGSDLCDAIVTIYRSDPDPDALYLIPRIVVLGIGCRKGTAAEEIEQVISNLLEQEHIFPEAVCMVASIDLKAGEPGLVEFCESHRLPFLTFPAGQLADVKGNFTASRFVQEHTGVDNVCERSAVLASGGTLLLKKHAERGVTVAAAVKPFSPDWRWQYGEAVPGGDRTGK